MPLSLNVDNDRINIDLEEDCNTIEIWNEDLRTWSNIILSDAQLEELKKFLNTKK